MAGDQQTQGQARDHEAGPATADPLIIWSADAQAAQPLVRALEKVCALEPCDDLPDPEDVKMGAKAPEMLLLCFSPVGTLCRAIAGGTPPSVALESWRAGAEAILAVNRRNRRRVHILDMELAIRDPGAVLRRFGWRDGAAAGGLQDAAPEAPDGVLLLLAQHCLSEDARAKALAAEMAALMVQSDPVTRDPDAVFQSYRETCWAGEETELLRAQIQPMLEETGLLRTQMQLTFEEMELLQQQNRTAQEEAMARGESTLQLEQRVAQLNQGIESYQAQLEVAQMTAAGLGKKVAEKDGAMKAASAMLRDLEAQADELTGALARARAGRAEMAQLADTLQQRVQRFEASRSYRLTAPLRRMRALILGMGSP